MLQVSFPILRQLAEKLLEKSVLIAAKPETKFSIKLALPQAWIFHEFHKYYSLTAIVVLWASNVDDSYSGRITSGTLHG